VVDRGKSWQNARHLPHVVIPLVGAFVLLFCVGERRKNGFFTLPTLRGHLSERAGFNVSVLSALWNTQTIQFFIYYTEEHPH